MAGRPVILPDACLRRTRSCLHAVAV